ncbi:unnamed protein product, partial [Callosobruchus maculatus]
LICFFTAIYRDYSFFGVYRSCKGSFDIFLEVFERLCREVSARFINYKTIWAGDFNINLAPSVLNQYRWLKMPRKLPRFPRLQARPT